MLLSGETIERENRSVGSILRDDRDRPFTP
jgi:hypothetical protein